MSERINEIAVGLVAIAIVVIPYLCYFWSRAGENDTIRAASQKTGYVLLSGPISKTEHVLAQPGR